MSFKKNNNDSSHRTMEFRDSNPFLSEKPNFNDQLTRKPLNNTLQKLKNRIQSLREKTNCKLQLHSSNFSGFETAFQKKKKINLFH